MPWESGERDAPAGLRTGISPLVRRQAATSARNGPMPARAQDAARPSSLREARAVIRQLRDDLVHAKRQLRSTVAKHEAAAGRVKQLTSELILCEQAERERIARLLHDDLQQLLSALQMRITLLSGSLSDEQATRTRVADAGTLIAQVLDVTRTLTAELSPPVLKGGDVVPTLDWLALRMEDMHGLRVEVVSARPLYAPAHLHVLLYQLVRELLFNVAKHAGVDRARLKLTREEDRLVLLVEDEGDGFEPAAARRPARQGGFGLNSVKERLALLGGGLSVEAAPGRGTRVTLFVPLEHEPAGAVAARATVHRPARPADEPL